MIQELATVTFQNLSHTLAFFIGLAGVGIICAGVVRALLFLIFHPKEAFPHSRLILGSHLVLGLDFFVGKDIIDTVLLTHGKIEYIDLVTLATVVGVRIVLNHFLLQEINEIKAEEKAAAEKKKKRK